MPRDLTRRQDVYADDFGQPGGRDELNPLSGVLDILGRCRVGERPSEREFQDAIGTMLGMIGEEKRRRDAETLPPQQPADVQFPRAGRAIGVDSIDDDAEPLPETDALTVGGERGMGRIMQDMDIPAPARDLAPRLLNNIVDNRDGTFSSADGSFRMGNREMLLSMIQRTLQEIGNELERSGGQGVAEIGPNLKVNVTTRLPNGRRQLKIIDPRKLTNG